MAIEPGAVEQDRAAGIHFPGVALDAVLVERDEDAQPVAVVVDLLLRQPEPEPGVAAADQRLVAVVGEQVEPETGGGAGECVAGAVEAVTGGAGNSDCDLRGHGGCS